MAARAGAWARAPIGEKRGGGERRWPAPACARRSFSRPRPLSRASQRRGPIAAPGQHARGDARAHALGWEGRCDGPALLQRAAAHKWACAPCPPFRRRPHPHSLSLPPLSHLHQAGRHARSPVRPRPRAAGVHTRGGDGPRPGAAEQHERGRGGGVSSLVRNGEREPQEQEWEGGGGAGGPALSPTPPLRPSSPRARALSLSLLTWSSAWAPPAAAPARPPWKLPSAAWRWWPTGWRAGRAQAGPAPALPRIRHLRPPLAPARSRIGTPAWRPRWRPWWRLRRAWTRR